MISNKKKIYVRRLRKLIITVQNLLEMLATIKLENYQQNLIDIWLFLFTGSRPIQWIWIVLVIMSSTYFQIVIYSSQHVTKVKQTQISNSKDKDSLYN